MNRIALEFVILFFVLPLGYYFSPVRISPLPLLWAVALYCYAALRRDPSFSMNLLRSPASWRTQLRNMLVLFGIAAVVLGLAIRFFTPDLLFGLIRERPWLWAVIMVAYPMLSVYPQSIVYRAFLMHRYAGFVARTGMSDRAQSFLLILLSAAVFAFMHIIFRNLLAVTMTFAGGLLFAWRYRASGSLILSAIEHSLYGCLLFTLGLGRYFYHGRF
jgi:membrane protease YdiL (CAAX protease family)